MPSETPRNLIASEFQTYFDDHGTSVNVQTAIKFAARVLQCLDRMGYGIYPKEPSEKMKAAGQWILTNNNTTVNLCVEANIKAEKLYRAMLKAAEEGGE